MEHLLEKSVLVLNRNWQAIHTCSARRAVHLLSTGHAKVVQDDGPEKFETHDFQSWLEYSQDFPHDQMIRSIQIAIRLPRILVLSYYDKFPVQEVTFSRRNVFLRDDHVCQYCHKEFSTHELNLDHVIPRNKGGPTTWENIVTSCIRCNSRKGDKLTHEAKMFPKTKPIAPRWKPAFSFRESSLEPSWMTFIAGK